MFVTNRAYALGIIVINVYFSGAFFCSFSLFVCKSTHDIYSIHFHYVSLPIAWLRSILPLLFVFEVFLCFKLLHNCNSLNNNNQFSDNNTDRVMHKSPFYACCWSVFFLLFFFHHHTTVYTLMKSYWIPKFVVNIYS